MTHPRKISVGDWVRRKEAFRNDNWMWGDELSLVIEVGRGDVLILKDRVNEENYRWRSFYFERVETSI